MAKTKIYFWLKVDKKFFDNLFIKRLKNMPGGYTMTVIYIRLMLESLEDDCILYYEGYFDSLVQELALKLDVSEDDINMTVAYFTKCGLIQTMMAMLHYHKQKPWLRVKQTGQNISETKEKIVKIYQNWRMSKIKRLFPTHVQQR